MLMHPSGWVPMNTSKEVFSLVTTLSLKSVRRGASSSLGLAAWFCAVDRADVEGVVVKLLLLIELSLTEKGDTDFGVGNEFDRERDVEEEEEEAKLAMHCISYPAASFACFSQ